MDPNDARSGSSALEPTAPSFAAFRAPEAVDAGLLVVHGAGKHDPITSLSEILAPTLNRLKEEGNLIGVRAFVLGDPASPGGTFDGLTVDYVAHPADPRAATQQLLVLDGRWYSSYLKPKINFVSSWAARHVARMMFEILRYHWRNWWLGTSALATLALFSTGVFYSGEEWTSLALIVAAFVTAWLAGLVEMFTDRRECGNYKFGPGWRAAVDGFSVSVTIMLFQIQRGLVILASAVGVLILPVLAVAVRLLATVPLLDLVAQGYIATIEKWALGEAASDIETISHNHVAAAAVQTRLRGALLEIEQRVRPRGTITVLGHSAGAPYSWWLLSEPDIHVRQARRPIPFRYRLITVGAALNWCKRGIDCLATPLDGKLVNHDRSERDGPWRTRWLNVYSTWDPAPHGPIKPSEYNGSWSTWGRRPRDADQRRDPNLAVRNLGSPISAEHSEYFRSQQEFIPALLRAIDPAIRWASRDTSDRRQEYWANARLAMISGLVRARMVVFGLPIAMTGSVLVQRRLFTCDDKKGLIDFDVIASLWKLFGTELTGRDDPGEAPAFVCNNIAAYDAATIIMGALVAYALVEVYTMTFWASMGRRERSLDPANAPPPQYIKLFGVRLRAPGCWTVPFLGAVPFGPALLLWGPTLLAPLILLPFNLLHGWYVLVGINSVMVLVEMVWFNNSLLGTAQPHKYPAQGMPVGRRRPSVMAG